MFLSESSMTIGVEFEIKSLQVDGKKVKLLIHHFSGEARHKFLVPVYVKGASGGLFIYDITNYSSLAHIDEWLSAIKRNIRPEEEFPIIVVGNKADLESEREVSHQEGIKIAKSRNMDGFIECSAKTGENVEKMFEALTRLMINYENNQES